MITIQDLGAFLTTHGLRATVTADSVQWRVVFGKGADLFWVGYGPTLRSACDAAVKEYLDVANANVARA